MENKEAASALLSKSLAKAKKNIAYNSVNELSRVMKARYDSLYHRYEDKSLTVIPYLKGSGRNSYNAFVRNSDTVNNSEGNLKRYYRYLTSAFRVKPRFDLSTITTIVCGLRSQFGLEPFKGKGLNAMCLKELYTVFIVKVVLVEDAKGKHKEYAPIFPVLA